MQLVRRCNSLYWDLGNNCTNLCFEGLSRNGVSVAPLHNFTYRWAVPERVGPGPSDPPCLTWMYSSAVDPVRDPSSGLVGPLLICRPGTLDDNNKQVKGFSCRALSRLFSCREREHQRNMKERNENKTG